MRPSQLNRLVLSHRIASRGRDVVRAQDQRGEIPRQATLRWSNGYVPPYLSPSQIVSPPGQSLTNVINELEITALCHAARDVFISQASLLEIDAPVKVRL